MAVDKDLDPLRELDHEELDDVVRAPTVTIGQSSRHAPTARMERSSTDALYTQPYGDGSFSNDPSAQSFEPVGRREPTPRQPIQTHSMSPEPFVGMASPPHSLPAVRPPGALPNRRYSPAKVRITENIQPKQTLNWHATLVPILSIFALGIAMAFAAFLVGNQQQPNAPRSTTQGASESPGSQVRPVRSTTQTSEEHEPPTFIEPLFGQFAVKRCNQRCEERGGAYRDACVRGCNALQIQNFGRRVTLDRFDPAQDANDMISRCMKKDVVMATESSGGRWTHEVESALKVLNDAPETLRNNDYAALRTVYHKLLDVNRDLRLPPGGTIAENNLAKDMVRGSCLFATSALIRLATGVVDSTKDSFSTRSYKQMTLGVEPKANEVHASIQSEAKALKIAPSSEGR